MTSILCLTLILNFSVLTSSAQNAPVKEKTFPTLRSNASQSDNSYHLEMEISLINVNPDKDFLDKLFEKYNRLYQRDRRNDTYQDFYEYTYIFKNLGTNKLKLNFSEWEFIHSPLTKIIQDFSFDLNENSTREIKFIANGPPETILSYINTGIWNKVENHWDFAGIGQASFYKPPFNTLFGVIKDMTY